MLRLIEVARNSENPQRHVIFVHGLGGHAFQTWQSNKADNGTFWPLWLADDIADVAIWTVSYSAPPSNWLGTAIPLQHRAVSVLAMLISEPKLHQGEIAFVGHSLGGLLIKQLLREANDQRIRQTAVKRLLDQIKAVVFYGTPHTGARLATVSDRLRVLVWPSAATKDLMLHDPNLRSLNTWYRDWSEHIRHRVYYETYDTGFGMVVDPSSADAGLVGANPIPLDGDHFQICKPADRTDQRYVLAREFFKHEAFSTQALAPPDTAVEVASRPELRISGPNILLPGLLRICAVSLIGLVLYRGVGDLMTPDADPNPGPDVTVTGADSVGIGIMEDGVINLGRGNAPAAKNGQTAPGTQQ